MIKPEFFDDPDIGELTPFARLAFIAMWLQADRAGRLIEDLRRLKARIFPYDPVDMEAIAAELHRKDMIKRYQAQEPNGRRTYSYIWIRNFAKHQRPHPKEPESLIPAFTAEAEKKHGEPFFSTEGTPLETNGSLDPLETNGTRNLESIRHSRTTKKPSSDVPAAFKHYQEGYFRTKGEKPNINGAKDGATLKRLLKTHGLQAVNTRIDTMLQSTDPFIQNSGCTIGVLSACWNKLGSKPVTTGKTAPVDRRTPFERARDAGLIARRGQ